MTSYGAIPVPGSSYRAGDDEENTAASAPGALNSLEQFASSFTRAQGFRAFGSPSRRRSFFFEATSGDEFSAIESGIDSTDRYYDDDDDDDNYDDNGDEYSEDGRHLDNNGLFQRRQSHSASATAMATAPAQTAHTDLSGPIGAIGAGDGVTVSEDSSLLDSGGPLSGPGPRPRARSRTCKDPEEQVAVLGRSTVPQTIFNSVNVLIGIGVFSLPLGFAYSGWVLGVGFMVFACASTMYTAVLLARCLDTDASLVSYADIAYAAFGDRVRFIVSILFSIELLGTGVSMFILFGDSLNALFPSISVLTFKLLAFVIVTPLSFLPLHMLSFSSLLGITGIGVLLITVSSIGLSTRDVPGSLLTPMETWAWPTNWFAAPLAIGIYMAPWGGHAVFPNIYRDMRHPKKYTKALVSVYQVTFLSDMMMGVVGFLMFGREILGEVTRNVLLMPNVSKASSYTITAIVGLVPLAKTPLGAKPVVSTVDFLLGLDAVPMTRKAILSAESPHSLGQRVAKISTAILTILSFCVLSIAFPEFERILAFAGSALCVTTCLTFPVAFYLKLFHRSLSRLELWVNYFLLGFSIVLAIVGTIWSVLPSRYFDLSFDP